MHCDVFLRDCLVKNPYVCERGGLGPSRGDSGGVAGAGGIGSSCNVSVSLSEEQTSAWITSPGFPERYPDDALCYTHITCPQGRQSH